MDPTRTLKKILSALGDLAHGTYNTRLELDSWRDDAVEGLRDLADWLEKGGTPPAIPQ